MATKKKNVRPAPVNRPISTGEIARRCGVSVPTVKKWIREGQLQAFRTPGGHYRVLEPAFRAFAARMGLGRGAAARGAARILVADDDERFRGLAPDMLGGPDGPWAVETVADGYEALLRVGLWRPDLLILDLRMPRLDGLQVCRRIRMNPVLRRTRILAITGYADGDTAAGARAAGADDFLEKPIDLGELRARVARLLDGRREARVGSGGAVQGPVARGPDGARTRGQR